MTMPAHRRAAAMSSRGDSDERRVPEPPASATYLPVSGLLSMGSEPGLRPQATPTDGTAVIRRGKTRQRKSPSDAESTGGGIAKPRAARKATEAKRLQYQWEQLSEVDKNPRLEALAARRGKKQVTKEQVTAFTAVVRPKPPSKDRLGNRIWSGERSGAGGLGWHQNVKDGMERLRGGGCQIRGRNCTGSADQIDHIKDFATEGTQVPIYLICDGEHHWKAAYRDDAMKEYNGGNTAEKDPPDLSNFQWSCKKCNSSKSGQKGNDATPPRHAGRCPEDGNCDYRPRRQPVG